MPVVKQARLEDGFLVFSGSDGEKQWYLAIRQAHISRVLSLDNNTVGIYMSHVSDPHIIELPDHLDENCAASEAAYQIMKLVKGNDSEVDLWGIWGH